MPPTAQGPGKAQGTVQRSAKKPKREGKSVRWIVIALLIAVAFMGWAFAAAGYASDMAEFGPPDVQLGQGRRRAMTSGGALLVVGLIRFLWNAVVQIPSAHRVAAHTVRYHPELIVLTVLFAGGVGVFGWWMLHLERQFAKEDERFRRVSEG